MQQVVCDPPVVSLVPIVSENEPPKPAAAVETALVSNHAVGGGGLLPTCSGCGAKFRRWDILRKHINKGWCSVFAKHDAKVPTTVSEVRAITVQDHVSISCRPEVIQAVIDRGLEGLRAIPGLLQEMQNRCVLCHTWIAHTYMKKNHYRNTHGEPR